MQFVSKKSDKPPGRRFFLKRLSDKRDKPLAVIEHRRMSDASKFSHTRLEIHLYHRSWRKNDKKLEYDV